MRPLAGFVGHRHRALAEREGLQRIGVARGKSRLHVPQAPRRAGDQRLDQKRHDVVVVGKGMVDAAHRGGVVVVPLVESLGADAVRLLEAPGQRLDQMTLRIFRSCAQPERDLEMLEGNLGEAIGLGLAVVAPGEIVEGPRAVGDAPMRHDAIRIELERLVETLHALFLVEAEAPVQAEIEPALRLRR